MYYCFDCANEFEASTPEGECPECGSDDIDLYDDDDDAEFDTVDDLFDDLDEDDRTQVDGEGNL
jgi:transcription initiation factor IIE alpha subunit